MEKTVTILGAGLAGSEAALQLAARSVRVRLVEMRPVVATPAHHSSWFAELVCSNSLKSMKPDSAAGMLKDELESLGSVLYGCALRHRVEAGGALAVNREAFAQEITHLIERHPLISIERREATSVIQEAMRADALMIATGPLTSGALARSLQSLGSGVSLSFYDAVAPIVFADSLNRSTLFRASRYEHHTLGDYLNAPFTKKEYDRFIAELLGADIVVRRSFETDDLFQACQPIEEIARKGWEAPRFGPLKPVGLIDPRTGKRPWAVVQLRAENKEAQSFNLVGFQTNLTFKEQERVFRLIPGLEQAEFCRFGVMHRNSFVDAPRILTDQGRLTTPAIDSLGTPIYIIGQLAGTEGYSEAIRFGLHGALALYADLLGRPFPKLPAETAFGALLRYATDPETKNYQPMHVNFGIMPPLEPSVRNKRLRYAAYAKRGHDALIRYRKQLQTAGLLGEVSSGLISLADTGEEAMYGRG